jgi:hypothetical protein
MKRPKHGATLKQYAYATKLLNAEGRSKKDIALSVGYSPSVAMNVENKIENTEGFQNAVIALATESNNMALAVMSEYKARGLEYFSNKDLNGALNAISQAWDRFNKHRAPNKSQTPEGNKLKAVIMQRVENQTINMPKAEPSSAPAENGIPDLDF